MTYTPFANALGPNNNVCKEEVGVEPTVSFAQKIATIKGIQVRSRRSRRGGIMQTFPGRQPAIYGDEHGKSHRRTRRVAQTSPDRAAILPTAMQPQPSPPHSANST